MAQVPVAWRHRQRGAEPDSWQEWGVVSWKPQEPESPRFQMRPLYKELEIET